MDTLERLEHDHTRCRATLDAMEAALSMHADTSLVVRELAFTLSQRLGEHARREADLISSCRGPVTARELVGLADGHGDELVAVRDALERLANGARDGAELDRLLRDTIAKSRHHMAEQEYKLFPTMRWVLRMTGSLTVKETSPQYATDYAVGRQMCYDEFAASDFAHHR